MNTIALRIFDFLKQYPPFQLLEKEQLLAVSQAVDVIYLRKEDLLFEIDQPIAACFYVVRDGAVGLFRAAGELADECDEGDIFGLRALVRKGTYMLNAKAVEESVVYSISSKILENYITVNVEANQFLMSSFVSNTRFNSIEHKKYPFFNPDLIETQTADYSKNPVVCAPETTVRDAAILMTKRRVGSVVIVNNNHPLGIITDKDLRTKIATGKFKNTEKVSVIMSSPVKTFSQKITVADAQIAMLRHRITHLCITKDGTPTSELTGILSEHDIIVLREHNASALIKEIKRTKTVEQLKNIRARAELLIIRYLKQDIPITFIGRMISAINEAITQHIIDGAIEYLGEHPPVNFAWLSLGSQGREEQLLLTDQDNALVFEDVPKEDYKTTKSYFLKLAKKITTDLNTVGFEFCPAQMMASHSKWCKSVSKWKKQFNQWITKPNQDHLMFCAIFFDFEHIYGTKKLLDDLSEHIFSSIDSHTIFLNFMGKNALLNPPPLGFFRQFLVEDDGAHKDQFDIKARAMMPLVDAARLLILSHNTKSLNNTVQRYKKLAKLEPQNKDVYFFCAASYKDLLRFRTKQGLKNKNSGRFIDLESLSKIDRLALKRTFKAVKSIQELIKTRFRLAQMM